MMHVDRYFIPAMILTQKFGHLPFKTLVIKAENRKIPEVNRRLNGKLEWGYYGDIVGNLVPRMDVITPYYGLFSPCLI